MIAAISASKKGTALCMEVLLRFPGSWKPQCHLSEADDVKMK